MIRFLAYLVLALLLLSLFGYLNDHDHYSDPDYVKLDKQDEQQRAWDEIHQGNDYP